MKGYDLPSKVASHVVKKYQAFATMKNIGCVW